MDSSGNIYISDTQNQVIRKVTPAGLVSTLAGLPGLSGYIDASGINARFASPLGVAVDSSGYVYIADGNEVIRKISPAGAVTTLAGGGVGSFESYGYLDAVGTAAQFASPAAVAIDSSGNVYVADTNNNAIRKITPSGSVSTLAGGPTRPPSSPPEASPWTPPETSTPR